MVRGENAKLRDEALRLVVELQKRLTDKSKAARLDEVKSRLVHL